jgi:hypothetical protein
VDQGSAAASNRAQLGYIGRSFRGPPLLCGTVRSFEFGLNVVVVNYCGRCRSKERAGDQEGQKTPPMAALVLPLKIKTGSVPHNWNGWVALRATLSARARGRPANVF